jgi:hypothetical protein
MATSSAPTTPVTTPVSSPSHADLAAVAATVAVVGVLMALLIAWLVVRLRRAGQAQAIPIVARRPASTASYTLRPSFAPSEASSKFGFARKPLRLSRPHEDGSWDFADPDPFSHQKEIPTKHRPAPLSPAPAYTPRTHRASTHKDEFGPRTPSTPALVEPPPAYCRGQPSPS